MTLDDRAIGEHMAYAYRLAMKSPDPSTQNGAVIIAPFVGLVGEACNTFPPRVTPRLERPEKYAFIEHAERGAIYAALRNGLHTNGATMICPWAACSDCARAIVLAGIRKLIRRPRVELDGASARWDDSVQRGDTILRESGVQIIEWDGSLHGRHTHPSQGPIEVLRDGKLLRIA